MAKTQGDIEHDPGGEALPLLPDEPEPPVPGDLPDVPVEPPDPAERAARAARSNRQIKYACTVCGREVGRENLKVKRVQYREMGVGGRIEKSRVVAWLCMTPKPSTGSSCLDDDTQYNQPGLAAAPGMADTHLAGTK